MRAELTASVTSPDGVNMRSGPGTSFEIVAVAPFGAQLSVSGEAIGDGWLPVLFSGQAGYVKSEFLEVQTSPSASGAVVALSSGPAVTPPPASSRLVVTPVASPAAGAPLAANSPTPTLTTAAGSVPTVIPLLATPAVTASPTGSATPATSGSSTAVATPVASATPALPTPDALSASVLSPDGLNLRLGPATTYAVSVTVPGNARVLVVGRPTSDGWYSVNYNGRLGWVDGRFLSFGGASTPAVSSSKFIWPVEGRRITTFFSSWHLGIDVDQFPSGGNPVVATAAGKVVFVGGASCCSYGLYVDVEHADGYKSRYAHLSSFSVQEGQTVNQGQQLGLSGNTGRSTGAHLHFEIYRDTAPVNPLALLPGGYVTD